MGTNGTVMVDPTKARCPKSPSKFRYLTVEAAWEKARERSTPKLEIVPYACDGCGNYHLADARNVGKDMVVAAPVGVTTEATSQVLAVPKFEPPQRNWAAVPPMKSPQQVNRENQRKIDEFLKDRKSASTQELKDLLGISTNGALRPYMKAANWYNTRGKNAKWIPRPNKPVVTQKPTPIRPVKEAPEVVDKPVEKPIVDITPKPDVDRFGRTQEEQAADPVDAAIARHPAGKARVKAKKAPVSQPQTLRIPLSNHNGVMRNLEIVVPGPLTEVEWTHMWAILTAMRPALVDDER